MRNSPLKWINCTLNDVAKIVSGGTPKSSVKEFFCEDGGVPWLTPADLSGYELKTIARGKRNITDLGYSSCSAKKMPKGSVLYSSRAPIGYVVVAENEISTNQGFKSFIPDKGINSYYLYYYLKSIKHIAEAKATGTTFKELSGTATKSLPFIMAPEAEQKRIVEKLDSLLAQVDTIQKRLNNLPNIIKRFRQSVLVAAVSGKLTERWREDNQSKSLGQINSNLEKRFDHWLKNEKQKLLDRGKKINVAVLSKKYKKPEGPLDGYFEDIPESWERAAWGQISNWITYGFTKPMPHFDGGFPIASAKSVRDGYMDLSKSHHTSKEAYDSLSDKDRPQIGDILITKDGTIGRCCLVEYFEDFCINQSVSVVQLRSTSVNRKFMLLCARSEQTQVFIRSHLKGTAIKHLSITDFAKCPLPLPVLEEQTEIVRLVEQYFALADTLEKNLSNAKQRVDNLTQSILAKAFKGELVPQDPNDEPADKLLERIKAARTEAEALEKATKLANRKASRAKAKS